jgi:hypothetical protein
MKYIPLVLFICFSLSLCNLTNRFTKSSEPGSSSSSGGSDITAEKAAPTAAQTAALAGGTKAVWDVQGMTWSVPPTWKEESKELNSFLWRSPGGFDAASLIVNVSNMPDSFPVESSLKATFDQHKDRIKSLEVDEVKWLEIDGVKGVQFREANPPKPDDHRRLQWIAFRKFGGQVQQVNVMLATSGKDFPRHQDAMYGVLYSTKLVH